MPTGPKADPFKPQQPQIPGVPAKTEKPATAKPSVPPVDSPVHPQPSSAPPQQASKWPGWLRVGLAAVIVIAILLIAWRVRVSSAKPAEPATAASIPAASSGPFKAARPLPVGPGEIGTDGDLGQAWSSKRFFFRNAITSAVVPALVVRLPGGDLWGISLVEPYGTCELAYITNLDTLRSEYAVRATHPMVVDRCSRTVYDLSRYASGPNGLVRGQVVSGRSIRPPIAIEVVQHGSAIVAVRME